MSVFAPLSRPLALTPGWAKNELWRKARAVPSLDLRFAESKSLVDAYTGQNLVTFTRASSGTFVGSNGLIQTASTDVPRFDHNPTTGESLGLLVEEQRTNSLTYSEDFANAAWVPLTAAVNGNATTAPDGATTADKLLSNSGSQGQITHTVAMTASTVFTYSVFAKKAEWNFLLLRLRGNDGTDTGAWFDLQTGGLGTVEAGNTATIQALANGWYRCTITRTSASGATAPRQRIIATNADNTWSAGDGTSGIFIWGAQLEAGAFPTSYIPTTTAAVTRSADVASITGTNFSSWYNQTEGTMFASCQNTQNTGGVVFGVGDTFDNTIYVTAATANNVAYRSGGSLQALITASISSSLSNVVFTYKANDFAATSNGGAISTDTSGAVPINPVRLKIGSSAWDASGTNIPGGHIRRLAAWPMRLANSTLQTITQ
jgi:hypothetical protein